MTSNKGAAYRFRDEVIHELHKAGFMDAHRPPEGKGLTLAERVRRDNGDIVGTPWALAVRASKILNLAAAQAEITAEAAQGGHELYASIHKRKSKDVDEAYAVLPLHVLIEVMRRLHPEELLSSQVRAGSPE